MVEFQNLFNPLLIILVIILTGFSIFIYRITNPPVPKRIRILLTITRSLALTIILLAIFNSIIGFSKTDEKVRENLFFIDNSKSVALKESAKRTEQVNKFISDFSTGEANKLFTFGSGIRPADKSKPVFKDTYTNFEEIEKFISKMNSDIASVTILSDGIITDGANPLYAWEKSAIPVFTVAIGDSAEQNDIILQEPQHNEMIYRGRPAIIESKILNKNFGDRSITVRLFEENTLIEQKNIVLSKNGIDNIQFSYTPKQEGEKRLSISIPPLKEESNSNNNSKSFLVKVLNDKIKTFMICGSPSPDVSIFSDMLLKNERIKLKSVVEISGQKQIKGGNADFPIDSTDLFVLVNYPSSNPNSEIFNEIKGQLLTKNKPFLISVGTGIDLYRLRELNPVLPFSIDNTTTEEIQTEVYADNTNNSLIKETDSGLWEMLPPVMRTKTEIKPKPGSEVLLKAKIKNVQTSAPVILTRHLNSAKSIAVIAGVIWKWRLQSNKKIEYLFDNFISNSLQWLNTPAEKKLFSIKSEKKVYSMGERIEITAYLYDELFNPVENALIDLSVSSNTGKYKTTIPHTANGIYKTEIENAGEGNLKITGNVKITNRTLSDSLNLFVDKNDIEMMNTRMDIDFLKQAAKMTGGSFFLVNDYSGLKEKLDKIALNKSGKLKKYFEIRFASNEIMLIILIMLFTFEWVIRKIYRLI